MRQGFSLIELLFALLLLEVGVLATVGMFLLAQENYRRAELILRGVIEAEWKADSLSRTGATGPGESTSDWGELIWAPVVAPVPAIRVSAWCPLEGDTLASVLGFPPAGGSLSAWPDPAPTEGR